MAGRVKTGSGRNPQLNKFGTGKHGFTAGNPAGGVPATTPGYEWFDMMQEEVNQAVEGAGLTPDGVSYNQLFLAIKKMAWGSTTALVPSGPTAADGTKTTQFATTEFVQSAVGGYLAKATTGGTITLTDAEASNPVIALTGALTADVVMVVPATVKRLWAIFNSTSGAFSLTVKTTLGMGVAVAQGKRNLVYTDGTNVLDGFNDFESVALTGTSTAPTAGAGTNTTQIATTAFVQAAIGSYLAKDVSAGGTITLTEAESSNTAIAFTGTLTAAVNVVVPTTVKRDWVVHNATSGAFALTVKTAAGTGVSVTQGRRGVLYTDGVNVYSGFTDFNSIAMTGTSTAPTAPIGTNTTQVASTAFVQAAVYKTKAERFTANGTHTVAANVTTIYVTACAGGGGGGGGVGTSGQSSGVGGGGGGGGGAGQSIVKVPYTVTPGQAIAITVGGGGTAGVGATSAGIGTGSSGGSGGSTVVGSLVTLTGGGGGALGGWVFVNSLPSGGGAGGSGGSGYPMGSTGGDGNYAGAGGVGASGPMGGGGGAGRGGAPTGVAGVIASGSGAGGGGGGGAYGAVAGNGGNGGAGVAGFVLIEW